MSGARAGLAALALLAAALLRVPSASAAEADWDTRLAAVQGEVFVVPAGGGEAMAAEAGMPLEAGDEVRTGSDGKAEVAVSADSLLELGPESEFRVDSAARSAGSFTLSLGRLVAKLRSLTLVRERLSFRTPTAVAAVRGTEFALEVQDDGGTALGVFDEGKVAVKSMADPAVEETVVESSQEVVLPPRGQEVRSRLRGGKRYLQVDALARLKAWKTGLAKLKARRDAVRRAWSALSREERLERRRKAMRAFRGKLQLLSPERRERIQRFLQATPEERRRLRQELREKIQQKRRERGAGRKGRGRQEQSQ
ncbi:MAG: hypothetical protein A2X36_15740 [Elusimicrobia bacterium GWA2_69_24]|nr:MAG: hypothetical protein A2X36_15740 [Elusimicrobia bacterium GWA2_69_24]HBL18786.1 hypothetical protein [Elusimicrobiota bacterium]